MENNTGEGITYKINTQRTYKVYVNLHNGKAFYKTAVKKKNYDNTETTFYKQLKFVKCTPPTDGEIIKITKGFEDLYVNQKDPYNAISVIAVVDYEKVENSVVAEQQAYEKYRQDLNSEDNFGSELPF
jgi:hypothetical protein|nr:MAG TPA: hypothetical protein [Caudoviricetes sp.]